MDTTVILQLATILAVVGSFFGLYRLLVLQKDATIESLKQQIALMRADFESIAVEALGKRVSIMERELERMQRDNDELGTLAREAIAISRRVMEEKWKIEAETKRLRNEAEAIIKGAPPWGGAYPIDDDDQSTLQEESEQ